MKWDVVTLVIQHISIEIPSKMEYKIEIFSVKKNFDIGENKINA